VNIVSFVADLILSAISGEPRVRENLCAEPDFRTTHSIRRIIKRAIKSGATFMPS